jgi:hypothetical protein
VLILCYFVVSPHCPGLLSKIIHFCSLWGSTIANIVTSNAGFLSRAFHPEQINTMRIDLIHYPVAMILSDFLHLSKQGLYLSMPSLG